MKVRMEVEFSREEVCEVMKQEYVRRFGKPAEGFYLAAGSVRYGVVEPVKVETLEGNDPAIPIPVPAFPPLMPPLQQPQLQQEESK